MAEEDIEEGTPAIFLRKVDVIIQNEGEEPIIIKATPEEDSGEKAEE
ncbi:MAG: hypothetical protein J6S67_11295 [Methanobrevibacter sp.]|nr:hypothetical protein [Methanobrevibacter sp.]